MPTPGDSNDRVFYEDVDHLIPDGRQYRFSGDVRFNGVMHAGVLPFASSGQYIPLYDGNVSTLVATQNLAYYIPFDVGYPMSLQQAIIEITTLANPSNCRFAIFTDDGTMNNPGLRIVNSGSINTDTTGLKIFSCVATLLPGRYWAYVVFQGGTPTFRATFSYPIKSPLPVSIGGLGNFGRALANQSGAVGSTTLPADSNVGSYPCVALRMA